MDDVSPFFGLIKKSESRFVLCLLDGSGGSIIIIIVIVHNSFGVYTEKRDIWTACCFYRIRSHSFSHKSQDQILMATINDNEWMDEWMYDVNGVRRWTTIFSYANICATTIVMRIKFHMVKVFVKSVYHLWMIMTSLCICNSTNGIFANRRQEIYSILPWCVYTIKIFRWIGWRKCTRKNGMTSEYEGAQPWMRLVEAWNRVKN